MPGLSGDLDGLSPPLSAALNQLAATCTVVVNSGYRSYEEQARLYDDYIHGRNGQAMAAPPGRSNHNQGAAVDLDMGASDMGCINSHAAALGLGFPVSGEAWHMEVVGDAANAPPPAPVEQDVLAELNSIVLGPTASSMLNDETLDFDGDEAQQAAAPTAPAAPSPTPAAPAATSGVLSDADIAATLSAAGFTGENLVRAVAHAFAESGGDIGARNPSGAAGLMQILPSAHPQYDVQRLLSDPAYNAQAAFEVAGGGTNFGPWAASASAADGMMDRARAAVAAIGGGTAATGSVPLAPTPTTDLSAALDPVPNTGRTSLTDEREQL